MSLAENERDRRAGRPRSVGIGIVGWDAVVGEALEQLLRGPDYRPKFLGREFPGKIYGSEAPLEIFILTPTPDQARRKELLSGLAELAWRIPILELVATGDEERPSEGLDIIRWPCSIEELRRGISASLRRAEHHPEGL